MKRIFVSLAGLFVIFAVVGFTSSVSAPIRVKSSPTPHVPASALSSVRSSASSSASIAPRWPWRGRPTSTWRQPSLPRVTCGTTYGVQNSYRGTDGYTSGHFWDQASGSHTLLTLKFGGLYTQYCLEKLGGNHAFEQVGTSRCLKYDASAGTIVEGRCRGLSAQWIFTNGVALPDHIAGEEIENDSTSGCIYQKGIDKSVYLGTCANTSGDIWIVTAVVFDDLEPLPHPDADDG